MIEVYSGLYVNEANDATKTEQSEVSERVSSIKYFHHYAIKCAQ